MPRARAACGCVTVGRNGDGAGEGIRLVEAAIDGFAQKLALEHRGSSYVGPAAAGRRIPDRERAGRRRALRSAPAAMRPDVFASLEHLEGAKGRLERVGERNGAPIFVDYAHKPDALAKALQALRPYAKRRLVVVFGAGGDRDAGKRPLMGEIAAENADSVIITDDNPRSENPDSDSRRDPGRSQGRARNRRPRRRDPRRDRGSGGWRCAAGRRQGPRDRADRRRPRCCRSVITRRSPPH